MHCCTEYDPSPTPAQMAIAAALMASPDIDLIIGHHAHVVQPFERVHGKWVAYGLGNDVAQQNRAATNDSVIARFTFTRSADGRFTVTAAEAIPTRIDRSSAGVTVVPTGPGDNSFQRVAPHRGPTRRPRRRPTRPPGLALHDVLRRGAGGRTRRWLPVPAPPRPGDGYASAISASRRAVIGDTGREQKAQVEHL